MARYQKAQNLATFLTIGRAAVFLGVSPATLRNWDRTGKLKATRHPINGYRLYSIEQLRELMADLDASGETG